MREITGDIWKLHETGEWITITTNGTLRQDGACVMGRGIAKQAKDLFPDLPHLVGYFIARHGNVPLLFPPFRLATFPVKHNWWERADLALIGQSADHLRELWADRDHDLYLVRPGCGNGRLNWHDVKPILEPHLDEHFIVVENIT